MVHKSWTCFFLFVLLLLQRLKCDILGASLAPVRRGHPFWQWFSPWCMSESTREAWPHPLESLIYLDLGGMWAWRCLKCSPSDSNMELGFRTTVVWCPWKCAVNDWIPSPVWTLEICIWKPVFSAGAAVVCCTEIGVRTSSRCLVAPCSPLVLVEGGMAYDRGRQGQWGQEGMLFLPALLTHKQFILVIVLIWGRWLYCWHLSWWQWERWCLTFNLFFPFCWFEELFFPPSLAGFIMDFTLCCGVQE